MSTTLNVGATAYAIQSAKPTTVYGQLAQIPLRGNAAGVLFQTSLAKIPAGATITSAVIRFHSDRPQAGTFTLQLYRTTARWPSRLTWNRRPALSSLVTQTSVTGPGRLTAINLNVTSVVQQLVSGNLPNHGWYASISQTGATLRVRGSRATAGKPVLIVTYTVKPPAPTGLEPSDAAVSIAKPTLLFDADPSITALQVQVDPAANPATAWSSGVVPATGGMLDLAATTYPGLADGATTFWRAQQQSDGGWSDWSSWEPFTREARPALTITSPAGAEPAPVADGTPPVTWTFAGTQVAWRARLLADNGDVIASSGKHAGTDTDWTPPKGLTRAGQQAVIEVLVWDDNDRAATPGDPVETVATKRIVLTPSGTVATFAGVTASSSGYDPAVTVTGTRSQIPDFVVLVRDGAEVGRWSGADVTVPDGAGFRSTVSDISAVMYRSADYQLAAVVNGARSAASAAVAHTPRCRGIWLRSVETGEPVVVWGDDEADQSQSELAIVHQPIVDTDDEVPVVRRRLVRSAPAGAISGVLADVGSYSAEEMEDRLRSWVTDDAGAQYLLTLGGYTGRVIIGDVQFIELPSGPADERYLAVALNWWQV